MRENAGSPDKAQEAQPPIDRRLGYFTTTVTDHCGGLGHGPPSTHCQNDPKITVVPGEVAANADQPGPGKGSRSRDSDEPVWSVPAYPRPAGVMESAETRPPR